MIGTPNFSPSFDRFIRNAVRLSMRLKLAPKQNANCGSRKEAGCEVGFQASDFSNAKGPQLDEAIDC